MQHYGIVQQKIFAKGEVTGSLKIRQIDPPTDYLTDAATLIAFLCAIRS